MEAKEALQIAKNARNEAVATELAKIYECIKAAALRGQTDLDWPLDGLDDYTQVYKVLEEKGYAVHGPSNSCPDGMANIYWNDD